jgi:hypothetical protein
MARGATKTAEQTAQGIGNTAAANQATSTAQANTAYGTLMPQIMSMLQPGGNPAVTAATMGSLGSSYGAADQGAKDTAARTNNAASTNATEDQLARNKGATFAQTAANNVMDQQSTADKLLSGIFGQSSNNATAAGGQRIGANNSYISGINSGNGVLKTIMQGISGAAGAAGKVAAG